MYISTRKNIYTSIYNMGNMVKLTNLGVQLVSFNDKFRLSMENVPERALHPKYKEKTFILILP